MEKHAYFCFPGLALLAAVLSVCLLAPAQEPERGPDGGTSTHVSGVEVLNVPGKPFTASTSTDWTRTLEDGSTLMLHLDARIVRDSQGRVYRENRHFVPAGSATPAPLHEIHIYDPVARVQIRCVLRAFTCFVSDYSPRSSFVAPQTGPSRDGLRTWSRENLGSQTIEGIFVNGTRESTTIEANAVGNQQPLVATREFWYSDELQTNLAVTRTDPRTGKQEIRLSKIVRGEPDPQWFQIPLGYTVRDMRQKARRSH
jgi:hypothetical protein